MSTNSSKNGPKYYRVHVNQSIDSMKRQLRQEIVVRGVWNPIIDPMDMSIGFVGRSLIRRHLLCCSLSIVAGEIAACSAQDTENKSRIGSCACRGKMMFVLVNQFNSMNRSIQSRCLVDFAKFTKLSSRRETPTTKNQQQKHERQQHAKTGVQCQRLGRL